MKLNGEFVIRQITDEILAVPIGPTALKFNGMIMLNDVSKVIWSCLENQTDPDRITAAVTDAFAVTEEEARADILEFLDKLRKLQLLEE